MATPKNILIGILLLIIGVLAYSNFKHLSVIEALNRELLHQAEHSHKALIEKLKLEKENSKLEKKLEENPAFQSNRGSIED